MKLHTAHTHTHTLLQMNKIEFAILWLLTLLLANGFNSTVEMATKKIGTHLNPSNLKINPPIIRDVWIWTNEKHIEK